MTKKTQNKKQDNGKKKRKFGLSWNPFSKKKHKNLEDNGNNKNSKKKKNGKKKDKKKKVNYKFVFGEYWNFLKNYKIFLFIILLAVITDSIIKIVDKYIFKLLIDKGTDFNAGLISSSIFVDFLILLLAGYIGIHLFDLFMDSTQIHFSGKLNTSIIAKIKKKYFNHIVDLDTKFHTNHKTGSLISKIARASGAVESFNDSIVWDIAPFLIQIIILSGVFAYFSWSQALILVVFSTVYLINTTVLSKMYQKYRVAHNTASDKEKASLADILTNISPVKYFGKNKGVKNIFKKFVRKSEKTDLREWFFWKWGTIPGSLLVMAGFVSLLVIPLREFMLGNITLGTVTFVYTSYITYLGALRNFSHSIRRISRSLTDMQELFEYGKVKKEIKDNPDAKNLNIQDGRIEFKDITFGYSDYDTLFNKFNLNIPKNKSVALVGQSGCGKSTLIKLLYRLYDVQGGSIRIDGQDIRNFKQESLRSEMSIVPQEPILFDDTIYNNIKFSNPSASKKEIMDAIKFAQLDRIINKLPKREKTIVGERGVKLSGGEKQRVSIARAILANKKVLVLDEATSALDSETEHEIQKDLYKLMDSRTSIIIAHRLSTIMHSDVIVVMKDGKIVQKGSHRELITEGGEYQRLWNLQKGGYVE